jgi:hypothetical protein
MEAEVLLRDFYAVFHGSREKFVVHKPPFKKESSGKNKASRVFYALLNPKSKTDKTKKPVSVEEYRDHLNGTCGCAIEPLCNVTDENGNIVARNMCYYGVIDIDVYGDAGKFLHLIRRMYQVGWKFCAYQSKSSGLHIYFMFRRPESADKVIEMLKKIITTYGLDMLYCDDKHKSKVEYFPMHATEVPGEDGKCVFLPYFNAASGKAMNRMITMDGAYVGLEKALEYIKQNYTTLEEMEETFKKLPYSDAPFCIQMMALTGALNANAGRNKFLFHACVYFKKKYGKDYDYLPELLDLDNCMEAPLQYEDMQGIQSTYASANGKEWNYSCKHDPMCSYCNRRECSNRQFSAVQKSNPQQNDNTGADVMGPISKVLARIPYYLWEIAAPGKEPKMVRFEDASELRNQLIVQTKCIDQLGWMPQQVKNNVWIDILNHCMEGMSEREIEVSAESDTTELNELHTLIIKYLTHCQVMNGASYMINAGQVYKEDGKYYFSTEGIKDYLRIERYTLGRTNLREELIHLGCEEGSVTYKTKQGKEIKVRCWVKNEDTEIEQRFAYYDDMYEQDALRAAAIKLADKEKDDENESIEEAEAGDEDSRF